MLNWVEGRSLQTGERVEVYYNIQKGGFSVVSLDKANKDKGRVCAHVSNVQIESASFHINEKKYNAIFEKNKKHVYAVVRGHLVGFEDKAPEGEELGYCNPYAQKDFVNWRTKKTIEQAQTVNFYDKYFSYTEE